MKILLTGGGTGGHFYPIVAVAQSLRQYSQQNNLPLELYYMAPEPYNQEMLEQNQIIFVRSTAGKLRRYFSIQNFFDLFKTAWGVLKAMYDMYRIFPDVVFGKGGYVSFPALVAARIYGIPVVIHESDSVPGRLNKWAGKFARRIAISYPTAGDYFKQEKIALTGNPIRRELLQATTVNPYETFKLEQNLPIILVMGGSQGSQTINEHLLNALPRLVEQFQIIHQTGKNNFDQVEATVGVVFDNKPHKERYHQVESLDTQTLTALSTITSLIISRAGSTIFEIAIWGIPAILIPITDSNGDHQRKNAYSYARTGAAVVIEETNLRSNIIFSEVSRIMADTQLRDKMKTAALSFSHKNAADLIAQEVIALGNTHK